MSIGIHLKNLALSLVLLCLLGCSHKPQKQTLSGAIERYNDYAAERLMPYFKQAGIHYPPREIALIAFKDTKIMELYARDEGNWRYIKAFPILAASGNTGPKLRRNDRQVPEGIYRIVAMNPNSHFDLSMKLNYPNDFDREQARIDGRTHLGDNIFIHGSHYSMGCLAIGNDAIEQLFELVYWVGQPQVQVIIAPTDLRYKEPVYVAMQPSWSPMLYQQIREAMQPFMFSTEQTLS